MDYLDVSDPERATFPHLLDNHEAFPEDLGSFVLFPQFNLKPQSRRTSNSAEPSETPATRTEPPEEKEESEKKKQEKQETETHTVSDRKRRYIEPAAPLPVAVVMVFKSLGPLLPERYDPDRRSLR